jgi:hypothetical protein
MSQYQITTTICILLFIACCITLRCIWNKRKDNEAFKKRHPKAQCTTMQYYDNDYCTIAQQIEVARNLYHLQHIKESIYLFKKRYAPYQNQFILHTDWKRLLTLWKEKNNSFILRIQLTPEQKN